MALAGTLFQPEQRLDHPVAITLGSTLDIFVSQVVEKLADHQGNLCQGPAGGKEGGQSSARAEPISNPLNSYVIPSASKSKGDGLGKALRKFIQWYEAIN